MSRHCLQRTKFALRDAYNRIIDKCYDLQDKYYDFRENRRRTREGKKLVANLTRKLGHIPSFGEILLETDSVPHPSVFIPPVALPKISDEERERLNEELMSAIRGYEQFETIKSLLDKGADPNGRDEDGTTPIMLAMYKYGGRAFHIYSLLKSRGADLNAKCNSGYTPLMMAARGCNLEACKWLIDAGNGKIEINAMATDNSTALDVAEEYKPYEEDAFPVYDYLTSIGVKHGISFEGRIKRVDEGIELTGRLLEGEKKKVSPDSKSIERDERQLKILRAMRSEISSSG